LSGRTNNNNNNTLSAAASKEGDEIKREKVKVAEELRPKIKKR